MPATAWASPFCVALDIEDPEPQPKPRVAAVRAR